GSLEDPNFGVDRFDGTEPVGEEIGFVYAHLERNQASRPQLVEVPAAAAVNRRTRQNHVGGVPIDFSKAPALQQGLKCPIARHTPEVLGNRKGLARRIGGRLDCLSGTDREGEWLLDQGMPAMPKSLNRCRVM